MKKILLTAFPAMTTACLLAQDRVKNATIENVNENGDWYASPWIWVAGAAIVIILLVFLSSGKETDPTNPTKK